MDYQKMERKYVMQTYSRFPVDLVKGRGIHVWDSKGKGYIDLISGIGVCGLGHCHPVVVSALKKQLDQLMHVSNLYYTEPQIELAEFLAKNSDFQKSFFCNSGTEANESAFKLAKKSTGRKNFIAFSHSFHGRTSGSLSLTWKEKYRKRFMPLMPGSQFAEFNNLESAQQLITKDTAGIIVEPVQGEGGIIPAKKDFLKGLRDICTDKDIALIFDEVQCGCGRAGKLFAYQTYGVVPDMMTLAKTLGGGFPIGALLATENFSRFEPGDHASTFGGNPMACTAAKATLEFIVKNKLPQKAVEKGEYFSGLLKGIKDGRIKEIRQIGLMIGMELDSADNAKECINTGINNGVLTCMSGQKTVRFLPPLIIEKEELREGFERVSRYFK